MKATAIALFYVSCFLGTDQWVWAGFRHASFKRRKTGGLMSGRNRRFSTVKWRQFGGMRAGKYAAQHGSSFLGTIRWDWAGFWYSVNVNPYGEMLPVWHIMTAGLMAACWRFVNCEADNVWKKERFVNCEMGDVGEELMNSLPHSVHWKVSGILGIGNCAI